ncbi:MAG: hypothetical protein KC731_38105 [Myxococcales bacterium]|nr:hypothetical protein [Myxococcales bacterium]
MARATVVLRQQLPRGRAGLNVVARALGMSNRVLQLRLAERGVTFRELLASVRAQEAAALLRDPIRKRQAASSDSQDAPQSSAEDA